MTRVFLFLLAVLCSAAPVWAQGETPPFSSTPVLLKGRSGGQLICGGTQVQDSLSLAPTCNATEDTATGFLRGASVNLLRSGSLAPVNFARGTRTVNSTYVPIVLTDASTWTIGAGGTCVNIGSEDASWCLEANVPHDCCTGLGTGSCGYCDVGEPIACDSDDDCLSGATYISQWWHTLDYAADPNQFESFAPIVLAPMVTVSGGGTRSLGHQAIVADAASRYYLTSGNATNMSLSSVDGILAGPIFKRISGSNTGTVGRVTGFYMAGGPGSAGWTIDDWIGFTMQDPTDGGGSTITDLGLADVPNLTGGSAAGQTFALRSAITAGTHKHFLLDTGGAQSKITGKVRIGDTTAPSAQLEVIGASSLGSTAAINASGTTTGATVLLNLLNENLTVGSGGGVSAIIGGGTVTLSANPSIFGVGNFFSHSTVYRNADGAGANDATNVTVASSSALTATPTFTADDNTGAFTLNNAILGAAAYTGLFFMPTFGVEEGGTGTVERAAAVTVGGLAGVGSGWTATDWTGVWMKNPASGGTYTNVVGLDCADLTRGGTLNACVRSAVSNSSGRYFLAHTGGADSVLSGSVSVGPTSLAAPSARLHVQEQTIGNEVARFESVATNDDPAERIVQARTTTSNNTATTALSLAVPSNTVYLVKAFIVARRTDSAGNMGGFEVTATVENNGGTTALVGTATANHTGTDGGWTATIDADNTTDTARIRVTGATGETITWHATVHYFGVSS